jgi:hypothetical protein
MTILLRIWIFVARIVNNRVAVIRIAASAMAV